MTTPEETAFAIAQEVLMQGAYIASTLNDELKSFRFDPFRRHFILEFALAKLAVLSVKSETLTDRRLADALLKEVDDLVTHRSGFEPNAREAFHHYQELARNLREDRDIPGKDLGLFFMERFERIAANLPEANGFFKKCLKQEDLIVSSSVVGDYCWPLKNETEAKRMRLRQKFSIRIDELIIRCKAA
jgi:hypothetical protein